MFRKSIVILILVSFTLSMTGCTSSVKFTVEELRKKDSEQKEKNNMSEISDIKFEAVVLSNDETVKFKQKSGRVDLDKNIVSGYVGTDDVETIALDSVKQLSHRKFSPVKTTILISLIALPIVLAIAIGDSMDFSIGGGGGSGTW